MEQTVLAAPYDIAPSRIDSPPHRRRITEGDVVLIVDDSPESLTALGSLLQGAGYRVKVANSGQTGLRLAEQDPIPSLILLDILMPDMDGHEVMRRLHAKLLTSAIPVIFLTSKNDAEEERAFDVGITDYIVKPFKPSVILARVRNQLLVSHARLLLQDQNHALEAEIERRMSENEQIQAISMQALARLAETRDNETGAHIQRTQSYVKHLAQRLAGHPRFSETLTGKFIATLTRSAPLHDIGKVGIPDSILLKPGKLDPAEWEIMKTHTIMGSEAITMAERDTESSAKFLEQAKEIARWHHERWDGKGYPDGLVGEDIPISARLMAVADVFDALISRRVYKEPLPFDKVRDIIASERGGHFDPDVAETFLDGWTDFEAIALHFGIEN